MPVAIYVAGNQKLGRRNYHRKKNFQQIKIALIIKMIFNA